MKISLKAARVNAGLTQDDVAKSIKVSKSTIVNYEKGRTSPDITTGKKLAELYGVSIENLIFLSEDCTLSTSNTSSYI
jgi:DNA-binding XRE family transcriptional regulator